MSVINTNIQALVAQQSLNINNRSLSKAMEQLASGKRINGAADDAAGLSIASKMTAQIRGLNQAVRNANDGISMLQTAEGAINEATNMLQRMRELAVQAQNSTYSSDDTDAINAEFTALSNEITRISEKTTWNGIDVLNADASYGLQIGAASGATLSFEITGLAVGSDVAAAIALSADDSTAISAIDLAITEVNVSRSSLGAIINRLQFSMDSMTNVARNTAASRHLYRSRLFFRKF